jgi:hypothetical protein
VQIIGPHDSSSVDRCVASYQTRRQVHGGGAVEVVGGTKPLPESSQEGGKGTAAGGKAFPRRGVSMNDGDARFRRPKTAQMVCTCVMGQKSAKLEIFIRTNLFSGIYVGSFFCA